MGNRPARGVAVPGKMAGMSLHPSALAARWCTAALSIALLASPAWAVVDAATTRQVAQGLARLDPWMPWLLVVWVALGGWSWWRIFQSTQAKRQLRARMGADAPADMPPPVGLLWLAGLCVLLLALLSWVVASPAHAGHAQLLAWDRAAQLWVQQHVSAPARQLLQHLTDTGDVLWLGLLSCGVALVMAARQRWLALQVWVFAIGLNGLITRVLKNSFGRERPEALVSLVTSGASYPSGHTAGAIIVYGLLWLVLRGRVPQRWRRAVGLLVAAWVAAISASRVLLEAHFASDVLAGALLGLAIWSAAAWMLARGQSAN